jgi:hypothetical protein
MSVDFQRTTRRFITEYRFLRNNRYKNTKSYINSRPWNPASDAIAVFAVKYIPTVGLDEEINPERQEENVVKK